ncbi:MAG: Ger(x)C family spore germination protein [Bacillaceae bacterium]|nr:Ger(x)C family spore germination protein [Bacillaceae bacterium]
MKKRRLQAALLVVLLTSLTLTGCWDRVEINDLAFVLASGFDITEEGMFRVAVQVPLPGAMGGAGSGGGGGGTGGDKSFYVDSGIGRTIRAANEDLQKRMSRQLFFAHQRVVIVGEELSRKGINPILDNITRIPQSRLTNYLLIAKGDALDILNADPHLERVPAEAIREIAKMGLEHDLKSFLYEYRRKGMDPIAPVVEVVQTQNKAADGQKPEVEIKHIGIFKRDKLQFITDARETNGILWMEQRMSGKSMTFPIDKNQDATINITGQSFKLDHRVHNNQPEFLIYLTVKGTVLENLSHLNLEKPQTYNHIENVMNQAIESQIKSILHKTMEKGIDTFGLGLHLYQMENRLWNEKWKHRWREILPDLRVTVKVDSHLERVGNVGKDPGEEEES